VAFNIGDQIPISIQERRFALRTNQQGMHEKKYTTGLVIITDLKYVEEVKLLCETYSFDQEYIRKRKYIPRTSRVIPSQPDQVLNQETHLRLLNNHENKLQQLVQIGLQQVTTNLLQEEFVDTRDSTKFAIESILDNMLHDVRNNIIHSINRNLSGSIILNAYKNKIGHALAIGKELQETLRLRLSATDFMKAYPRPEEKLYFLVECNVPINQISFVPRTTTQSYAEALVQQLEEISIEGDSTESENERNWDEVGTYDLPKAGGISSNYSLNSGNSSLKTHN